MQPQQQLRALVSGHLHVAYRHSSSQAAACRSKVTAKSVWRAADLAAYTSVSLTAGPREVKNVTSFSTRVAVPFSTSKARTCWI